MSRWATCLIPPNPCRASSADICCGAKKATARPVPT
jgi:hypothetical protein